jgi:hypothetical protein
VSTQSTRRPKPSTSAPWEPEALHRELYRRSQTLTRSAHALDAAAVQLREAHVRDHGKAATDVRSAALVAMHAALSAYELVGAYDLAAWLNTQVGEREDE